MELKASLKDLTNYLEKNLKLLNEDYKEKYKELEQVSLFIKDFQS